MIVRFVISVLIALFIVADGRGIPPHRLTKFFSLPRVATTTKSTDDVGSDIDPIGGGIRIDDQLLPIHQNLATNTGKANTDYGHRSKGTSRKSYFANLLNLRRPKHLLRWPVSKLPSLKLLREYQDSPEQYGYEERYYIPHIHGYDTLAPKIEVPNSEVDLDNPPARIRNTRNAMSFQQGIPQYPINVAYYHEYRPEQQPATRYGVVKVPEHHHQVPPLPGTISPIPITPIIKMTGDQPIYPTKVDEERWKEYVFPHQGNNGFASSNEPSNDAQSFSYPNTSWPVANKDWNNPKYSANVYQEPVQSSAGDQKHVNHNVDPIASTNTDYNNQKQETENMNHYENQNNGDIYNPPLPAQNYNYQKPLQSNFGPIYNDGQTNNQNNSYNPQVTSFATPNAIFAKPTYPTYPINENPQNAYQHAKRPINLAGTLINNNPTFLQNPQNLPRPNLHSRPILKPAPKDHYPRIPQVPNISITNQQNPNLRRPNIRRPNLNAHRRPIPQYNPQRPHQSRQPPNPRIPQPIQQQPYADRRRQSTFENQKPEIYDESEYSYESSEPNSEYYDSEEIEKKPESSTSEPISSKIKQLGHFFAHPLHNSSPENIISNHPDTTGFSDASTYKDEEIPEDLLDNDEKRFSTQALPELLTKIKQLIFDSDLSFQSVQNAITEVVRKYSNLNTETSRTLASRLQSKIQNGNVSDIDTALTIQDSIKDLINEMRDNVSTRDQNYKDIGTLRKMERLFNQLLNYKEIEQTKSDNKVIGRIDPSENSSTGKFGSSINAKLEDSNSDVGKLEAISDFFKTSFDAKDAAIGKIGKYLNNNDEQGDTGSRLGSIIKKSKSGTVDALETPFLGINLRREPDSTLDIIKTMVKNPTDISNMANLAKNIKESANLDSWKDKYEDLKSEVLGPVNKDNEEDDFIGRFLKHKLENIKKEIGTTTTESPMEHFKNSFIKKASDSARKVISSGDSDDDTHKEDTKTSFMSFLRNNPFKLSKDEDNEPSTSVLPTIKPKAKLSGFDAYLQNLKDQIDEDIKNQKVRSIGEGEDLGDTDDENRRIDEAFKKESERLILEGKTDRELKTAIQKRMEEMGINVNNFKEGTGGELKVFFNDDDQHKLNRTYNNEVIKPVGNTETIKIKNDQELRNQNIPIPEFMNIPEKKRVEENIDGIEHQIGETKKQRNEEIEKEDLKKIQEGAQNETNAANNIGEESKDEAINDNIFTENSISKPNIGNTDVNIQHTQKQINMDEMEETPTHPPEAIEIDDNKLNNTDLLKEDIKESYPSESSKPTDGNNRNTQKTQGDLDAITKDTVEHEISKEANASEDEDQKQKKEQMQGKEIFESLQDEKIMHAVAGLLDVFKNYKEDKKKTENLPKNVTKEEELQIQSNREETLPYQPNTEGTPQRHLTKVANIQNQATEEATVVNEHLDSQRKQSNTKEILQNQSVEQTKLHSENVERRGNYSSTEQTQLSQSAPLQNQAIKEGTLENSVNIPEEENEGMAGFALQNPSLKQEVLKHEDEYDLKNNSKEETQQNMNQKEAEYKRNEKNDGKRELSSASINETPQNQQTKEIILHNLNVEGTLKNISTKKLDGEKKSSQNYDPNVELLKPYKEETLKKQNLEGVTKESAKNGLKDIRNEKNQVESHATKNENTNEKEQKEYTEVTFDEHEKQIIEDITAPQFDIQVETVDVSKKTQDEPKELKFDELHKQTTNSNTSKSKNINLTKPKEDEKIKEASIEEDATIEIIVPTTDEQLQLDFDSHQLIDELEQSNEHHSIPNIKHVIENGENQEFDRREANNPKIRRGLFNWPFSSRTNNASNQAASNGSGSRETTSQVQTATNNNQTAEVPRETNARRTGIRHFFNRNSEVQNSTLNSTQSVEVKEKSRGDINLIGNFKTKLDSRQKKGGQFFEVPKKIKASLNLRKKKVKEVIGNGSINWQRLRNKGIIKSPKQFISGDSEKHNSKRSTTDRKQWMNEWLEKIKIMIAKVRNRGNINHKQQEENSNQKEHLRNRRGLDEKRGEISNFFKSRLSKARARFSNRGEQKEEVQEQQPESNTPSTIDEAKVEGNGNIRDLGKFIDYINAKKRNFRKTINSQSKVEDVQNNSKERKRRSISECSFFTNLISFIPDSIISFFVSSPVQQQQQQQQQQQNCKQGVPKLQNQDIRGLQGYIQPSDQVQPLHIQLNSGHQFYPAIIPSYTHNNAYSIHGFQQSNYGYPPERTLIQPNKEVETKSTEFANKNQQTLRQNQEDYYQENPHNFKGVIVDEHTVFKIHNSPRVRRNSFDEFSHIPDKSSAGSLHSFPRQLNKLFNDGWKNVKGLFEFQENSRRKRSEKGFFDGAIDIIDQGKSKIQVVVNTGTTNLQSVLKQVEGVYNQGRVQVSQGMSQVQDLIKQGLSAVQGVWNKGKSKIQVVFNENKAAKSNSNKNKRDASFYQTYPENKKERRKRYVGDINLFNEQFLAPNNRLERKTQQNIAEEFAKFLQNDQRSNIDKQEKMKFLNLLNNINNNKSTKAPNYSDILNNLESDTNSFIWDNINKNKKPENDQPFSDFLNKLTGLTPIPPTTTEPPKILTNFLGQFLAPKNPRVDQTTAKPKVDAMTVEYLYDLFRFLKTNKDAYNMLTGKNGQNEDMLDLVTYTLGNISGKKVEKGMVQTLLGMYNMLTPTSTTTTTTENVDKVVEEDIEAGVVKCFYTVFDYLKDNKDLYKLIVENSKNKESIEMILEAFVAHATGKDLDLEDHKAIGTLVDILTQMAVELNHKNNTMTAVDKRNWFKSMLATIIPADGKAETKEELRKLIEKVADIAARTSKMTKEEWALSNFNAEVNAAKNGKKYMLEGNVTRENTNMEWANYFKNIFKGQVDDNTTKSALDDLQNGEENSSTVTADTTATTQAHTTTKRQSVEDNNAWSIQNLLSSILINPNQQSQNNDQKKVQNYTITNNDGSLTNIQTSSFTLAPREVARSSNANTYFIQTNDNTLKPLIPMTQTYSNIKPGNSNAVAASRTVVQNPQNIVSSNVAIHSTSSGGANPQGIRFAVQNTAPIIPTAKANANQNLNPFIQSGGGNLQKPPTQNVVAFTSERHPQNKHKISVTNQNPQNIFAFSSGGGNPKIQNSQNVVAQDVPTILLNNQNPPNLVTFSSGLSGGGNTQNNVGGNPQRFSYSFNNPTTPSHTIPSISQNPQNIITSYTEGNPQGFSFSNIASSSPQIIPTTQQPQNYGFEIYSSSNVPKVTTFHYQQPTQTYGLSHRPLAGNINIASTATLKQENSPFSIFGTTSDMSSSTASIPKIVTSDNVMEFTKSPFFLTTRFTRSTKGDRSKKATIKKDLAARPTGKLTTPTLDNTNPDTRKISKKWKRKHPKTKQSPSTLKTVKTTSNPNQITTQLKNILRKKLKHQKKRKKPRKKQGSAARSKTRTTRAIDIIASTTQEPNKSEFFESEEPDESLSEEGSGASEEEDEESGEGESEDEDNGKEPESAGETSKPVTEPMVKSNETIKGTVKKPEIKASLITAVASEKTKGKASVHGAGVLSASKKTEEIKTVPDSPALSSSKTNETLNSAASISSSKTESPVPVISEKGFFNPKISPENFQAILATEPSLPTPTPLTKETLVEQSNSQTRHTLSKIISSPAPTPEDDDDGIILQNLKRTKKAPNTSTTNKPTTPLAQITTKDLVDLIKATKHFRLTAKVPHKRRKDITIVPLRATTPKASEYKKIAAKILDSIESENSEAEKPKENPLISLILGYKQYMKNKEATTQAAVRKDEPLRLSLDDNLSKPMERYKDILEELGLHEDSSEYQNKQFDMFLNTKEGKYFKMLKSRLNLSDKELLEFMRTFETSNESDYDEVDLLRKYLQSSRSNEYVPAKKVPDRRMYLDFESSYPDFDVSESRSYRRPLINRQRIKNRWHVDDDYLDPLDVYDRPRKVAKKSRNLLNSLLNDLADTEYFDAPYRVRRNFQNDLIIMSKGSKTFILRAYKKMLADPEYDDLLSNSRGSKELRLQLVNFVTLLLEESYDSEETFIERRDVKHQRYSASSEEGLEKENEINNDDYEDFKLLKVRGRKRLGYYKNNRYKSNYLNNDGRKPYSNYLKKRYNGKSQRNKYYDNDKINRQGEDDYEIRRNRKVYSTNENKRTFNKNIVKTLEELGENLKKLTGPDYQKTNIASLIPTKLPEDRNNSKDNEIVADRVEDKDSLNISIEEMDDEDFIRDKRQNVWDSLNADHSHRGRNPYYRQNPYRRHHYIDEDDLRYRRKQRLNDQQRTMELLRVKEIEALESKIDYIKVLVEKNLQANERKGDLEEKHNDVLENAEDELSNKRYRTQSKLLQIYDEKQASIKKHKVGSSVESSSTEKEEQIPPTTHKKQMPIISARNEDASEEARGSKKVEVIKALSSTDSSERKDFEDDKRNKFHNKHSYIEEHRQTKDKKEVESSAKYEEGALLTSTEEHHKSGHKNHKESTKEGQQENDNLAKEKNKGGAKQEQKEKPVNGESKTQNEEKESTKSDITEKHSNKKNGSENIQSEREEGNDTTSKKHQKSHLKVAEKEIKDEISKLTTNDNLKQTTSTIPEYIIQKEEKITKKSEDLQDEISEIRHENDYNHKDHSYKKGAPTKPKLPIEDIYRQKENHTHKETNYDSTSESSSTQSVSEEIDDESSKTPNLTSTKPDHTSESNSMTLNHHNHKDHHKIDNHKESDSKRDGYLYQNDVKSNSKPNLLDQNKNRRPLDLIFKSHAKGFTNTGGAKYANLRKLEEIQRAPAPRYIDVTNGRLLNPKAAQLEIKSTLDLDPAISRRGHVTPEIIKINEYIRAAAAKIAEDEENDGHLSSKSTSSSIKEPSRYISEESSEESEEKIIKHAEPYKRNQHYTRPRQRFEDSGEEGGGGGGGYFQRSDEVIYRNGNKQRIHDDAPYTRRSKSRRRNDDDIVEGIDRRYKKLRKYEDDEPRPRRRKVKKKRIYNDDIPIEIGGVVRKEW